MSPSLPVAEVRAAIAAEDWTRAADLLERHRRTMVDALSRTNLAQEPLGPWRDLLAAQRALAAEVREARDAAAASLDKLGRDLRGARAWMRELA